MTRAIRKRLGALETNHIEPGRVVYVREGETRDEAEARSLKAWPIQHGDPVRCKSGVELGQLFLSDQAKFRRELSYLSPSDLRDFNDDLEAALQTREADDAK